MIDKKIYGLMFALLVATSSFAQEIDQDRMDRDLKIAENILGTISNNNDRSFFSSSRSIESNYIPDYGVIFSLPQNTIVYQSSSKGVKIVGRASQSQGSNYSYGVADDDDDDDDEEEDERRSKEREEYDEKMEEIDAQVEDHLTLFLVDYADLIGQLKPTDRIMVNVKSSNNQVWISGSNIKSKQSVGKTAEILKSDLIAYKQGKASRDATIDKIKFSETGDNPKEKDLELFSSIFARLYEPDLSSTYYTSSRNINFERLENLGAIYSMRVYSSSSEDGLHTIRTTGERGLTQKIRDEKVTAMYPDFEKSIKENLLDYGRTIRSLNANEMLILKIRLTDCKGCEMPKSIEVSLKANTLSDFNSGKLNRDNALKAIKIKKTSN